MTTETLASVTSLHDALAKIGGISKGFRTGDRVSITVDDVTAYGTIAEWHTGWHTFPGRKNAYPVILDGTGQYIEIHQDRMEKIA
jgi:putative aminopeptidase FrvX